MPHYSLYEKPSLQYLTRKSFFKLTTSPYSELIAVEGIYIDNLCGICSERYEYHTIATALKCRHCFCTYCAMEWLIKHSHLCPTCRHPN